MCVVALWARGHVTMVGRREATGIEATGGARHAWTLAHVSHAGEEPSRGVTEPRRDLGRLEV